MIDILYRVLKGVPGTVVFLPSLIIAPLFFILSCLLNSLFYKLEEGRQFWGYFRDTFVIHLPSASLLSLSSLMVALSFPKFGILALLMFALPLILSRLSFLSNPEEWEIGRAHV